MSPDILPHQKILRKVIHAAYSASGRAMIDDPNHSLGNAGEAASRGEGNLFIINHIGTGDLLAVLIPVIFGTPGLKNRHALSPQSFHQSKPIVDAVIRQFGSEFSPVINPNTENHPLFRKLPPETKDELRTSLMIAFLKNSAQTLDSGGTVVLAANAGRLPRLDLDGFAVLTPFLLQMQRKKVRPFWITALALSLQNQIPDGKRERGLNLLNHYNLVPGVPLLSTSMKPIILEAFIRAELNLLLPRAYRHTPRE